MVVVKAEIDRSKAGVVKEVGVDKEVEALVAKDIQVVEVDN